MMTLPITGPASSILAVMFGFIFGLLLLRLRADCYSCARRLRVCPHDAISYCRLGTASQQETGQQRATGQAMQDE